VLLLLTDDKCTALADAPVLKHIISSLEDGLYVAAVTSLGDDIFVLGSRDRLKVYDANTFKYQSDITIPGIHSFGLLAACYHFGCLYVTDDFKSIYRVDLSEPGRKTIKTWKVAYRPYGMSVNNAHNLIVACGVNNIHEYTTHGTLVREICLEPDMIPLHAIQLSTGDYVVINRPCDSPEVISVVGEDGIIRSTSRAFDMRDVNEASLAVTKNDVILIVDSRNNRILSTNHLLSSTCIQEVHLPVSSGITHPIVLYLDESKDRLYVGDTGGKCRLLVFENVKLQ